MTSHASKSAAVGADGEAMVSPAINTCIARQITPELRFALDVVRAFAAIYVVIHHLVIRLDPFPLIFLFKFGQEAVMTFFLLSGFVIHANERHRCSGGLRGYLLRRGFRIYPTLIFAMILSVLVALWNGDLLQRFEASKAACTLFALQDAASLKPGTICSSFMGNSPLWSLSYELLFYAVYPLVLGFFLRKPNVVTHAIGIGTLGLIVAFYLLPSHFFLLPAYFVVWWAGAMLAERSLNAQAAPRVALWPIFYLFAATSAWGVVTLLEGVDQLGTYPVLMVRHFGLALLMVLAAISPVGRRAASILSLRSAAFWAWLAAISYGIYVFHFPLLIQWSVADTAVGFAFAVVVLLILSDLGDRQTSNVTRRLLRRWKTKKSAE